MKTTTIETEVIDKPSTSNATIDIRIEKKEFEIFTENCTCVIDEVEFVKIIDLETKMPLPVVDAQQRYLGAVTQTVLLQKMVDIDAHAQVGEAGHE